eukprot:2388775-Prymnesium_polylepis.1
MTGADGAPGPRAWWLEEHLVIHDPRAGGKSARYRADTNVSLQNGERAFVVTSDLISFVSHEITCQGREGEQLRIPKLW